MGKNPEICRINVEEKLSLRGWIFRIQTPSHIPLNSYLQISPGLLIFSVYLASHLITSICKTNKISDAFVLLIDNPAALLLHALDFRKPSNAANKKYLSSIRRGFCARASEIFCRNHFYFVVSCDSTKN